MMRTLLPPWLVLLLPPAALADIQDTGTAPVDTTPDSALITVQVLVRGMSALEVASQDKLQTDALSRAVEGAGIDPKRGVALSPPVVTSGNYRLLPLEAVYDTSLCIPVVLWTSTRKVMIAAPLTQVPGVLASAGSTERTIVSTTYRRQDMRGAQDAARAQAMAEARRRCLASAQVLGVGLGDVKAAVFTPSTDGMSVSCTLTYGQK